MVNQKYIHDHDETVFLMFLVKLYGVGARQAKNNELGLLQNHLW